MAMIPGSVNGAGVGTGLAKELFDDYEPKLGITGPGAAVAKQQIADLCNSIAQVVVAHIAANATIATSGTVVVTSVSGVTTGPGVSGPGAGTASSTGTIA